MERESERAQQRCRGRVEVGFDLDVCRSTKFKFEGKPGTGRALATGSMLYGVLVTGICSGWDRKDIGSLRYRRSVSGNAKRGPGRCTHTCSVQTIPRERERESSAFRLPSSVFRSPLLLFFPRLLSSPCLLSPSLLLSPSRVTSATFAPARLQPRRVDRAAGRGCVDVRGDVDHDGENAAFSSSGTRQGRWSVPR